MRIGPYTLPNNIGLAPMAGVTDLPFRRLCRRLGAGFAAGEMVTADTRLWDTEKTRRRLDHSGEPAPRWVQIAGGDPRMMADAARANVTLGAQIIDLNLGCPAKKVCRKAAGSALLRDPGLVRAILEATVDAVDVPVTLKTRTGWDHELRNGPEIVAMAQDCGIAAVAVHGRTRADGYRGEAEYDTIRGIVRDSDIPILANGDIGSPQRAEQVLAYTGAAGLLVGRAAQGRPWIFREILSYLETGTEIASLPIAEVRAIMLGHLRHLHRFYGEYTGVRVARKHIGWYCKGRPDAEAFRRQVVRVESAAEQLRLTETFLGRQLRGEALAA